MKTNYCPRCYEEFDKEKILLENNICPYCDWSDSNYYFFLGGHLSQWSYCMFKLEGITFNCSEQYMMYKKAMLYNADDIAQKILSTSDASYQKRLGREVPINDFTLWDKHKFNIVVNGNLAKFSQDLEHKTVLLNTKNKIIAEASETDCIWGIGLDTSNPDIWDTEKWRGLNLLGKALMLVRSELDV